MSQKPVRNQAAATQFVDFSKVDLACGKQGTDIDYSMDYCGRIFVFGDFKRGGAEPPMGQKMHLQFKVEAMRSAKPSGELLTDACAFIASHGTQPDQPLDPTTSIVTHFFWQQDHWQKLSKPVKFVQFINTMVERMKKKIVTPF